MDIVIPGYGELHLSHMVMDYNGTLAVDGVLLPGVAERLDRLGGQLTLHVVTADTFGQVKNAMKDLCVKVEILPPDNQDRAKRDYIRSLGAAQTVAVGNGRNDRLMLEDAGLGIGLILGEGAFSGTLAAADVVFTSVTDALDLLLHPLRLTATLRS